MQEFSRRSFSKQTLGSLLTLSLLETALRRVRQGAKIEKGIKTGRVYIGPDGEQLSKGRILAKKIDSKLAFEKYG